MLAVVVRDVAAAAVAVSAAAAGVVAVAAAAEAVVVVEGIRCQGNASWHAESTDLPRF